MVFQSDFSSNETVYSADVLISDWSGIAFEYAFATQKPVLFIDTPMKVSNPEYAEVITTPLNLTLRGEIGVRLPPEQADRAGQEVSKLLEQADVYAQRIGQLTDEYLYNMGCSGEVGGKYILPKLKERAKQKNTPV